MKIIFDETSTIGLRFYEIGRKTLKREIKEFDTKFGKIRFKVSSLDNRIIRISPEYEDCKRVAKRLDMSLIEVMKRVSFQHTP